MKKYLYGLLFILSLVLITSCQSSNTSQLEATNQALTNQLNTLMSQLTQEATSPTTKAQKPLTTPGAPTTGESEVITPNLIFSGSGLVTDFANSKYYESLAYGSMNVHMVCSPTSTNGGGVWIDAQLQIVYCKENGETWDPWGGEVTKGNHTVYSTNASDTYEFWSVGTPPFTIRNKNSNSDYIFIINNVGEYNLSANVTSGVFEVDVACQDGSGDSYRIGDNTTETLRVMKPSRCKLTIKDITPVGVGPGDIEVSLAAAK